MSAKKVSTKPKQGRIARAATKSKTTSSKSGFWGKNWRFGRNKFTLVFFVAVFMIIGGAIMLRPSSANRYTGLPSMIDCKGRVLSQGSTGGCVRFVQAFMHSTFKGEEAYLDLDPYFPLNPCSSLSGYQPIGVDGVFGPETNRYVRCFQYRRPSLVVDGVVGPKTWEQMRQIIDFCWKTSHLYDYDGIRTDLPKDYQDCLYW